MITLRFYGGAEKVTGSAFYVETPRGEFLVDCGAEQDVPVKGAEWKEKIEKLPKVDYCLLTHAHYDHCGLLPLAVKLGRIRKGILSTPATRALAELILMDSVRIQKEELSEVLYTEKDVEETMKLWEVIDEDNPRDIDGVRVTFYYAGHILGSAGVYIETEDTNVFFTGDIGTSRQRLLRYPPSVPEDVHALVIESTYGGRRHDERDPHRLRKVIEETCSGGGRVLIPVFAVGRLQEVLYELAKMRLPWKVYVDTPMGGKVTELYRDYSVYLNPEIRKRLLRGDFSDIFGQYEVVNTHSQSEELSRETFPCIILSASGMLEGGRVMNHFERIKKRKDSAVVFVGYQAEGTRGRAVQEGREPVSCRVETMTGFSAHADGEELIGYIRRLRFHPFRVFVVHGEQEGRQALKRALEEMKLRSLLPGNLTEDSTTTVNLHKEIFVSEEVLRDSVVEVDGLRMRPRVVVVMKEDRLELRDHRFFIERFRQEDNAIEALVQRAQGGIYGELEIEQIEMTRVEFEEALGELFECGVLSKRRLREFLEKLLGEGPQAARKYVIDVHKRNPNTGYRRWQRPTCTEDEEMEEALYERAYRGLLWVVQRYEEGDALPVETIKGYL